MGSYSHLEGCKFVASSGNIATISILGEQKSTLGLSVAWEMDDTEQDREEVRAWLFARVNTKSLTEFKAGRGPLARTLESNAYKKWLAEHVSRETK